MQCFRLLRGGTVLLLRHPRAPPGRVLAEARVKYNAPDGRRPDAAEGHARSASSPLAMGRERKGVAGGTAAREKSVAERYHSRGEQHQGLEPPSTAGMAQEVLQQARSLLGRVTCTAVVGRHVRSGGRRDTATRTRRARLSASPKRERNVNIFVHVLNVSFRIPRFIPHARARAAGRRRTCPTAPHGHVQVGAGPTRPGAINRTYRDQNTRRPRARHRLPGRM